MRIDFTSCFHFLSDFSSFRWTGLGLFLSGIAIEMLSEESRKKFKSDPRNKGKVDGTGLFGVV